MRDALNPRHGQRHGRLSVIEPLQLRSVRRIGARLRLAVIDRGRKRHVISFYFASGGVAERYVAQMSEWIVNRTPLAYVKGGDHAVLLEIDELLRRTVAAY